MNTDRIAEIFSVSIPDWKAGVTQHASKSLLEGERRKEKSGFRTKSYFKKSYDDKPLISIVTVVFNSEKHLEETIQSVINQTYENIEYIIIDGDSTDGTVDIIKKYEKSIDYWISEKDSGIYNAMNKGINLASGKWINFMNAGDTFIDCTVLTKLNSDFSDISNDIIYGNINIINSINSTIYFHKIDRVINKDFLAYNTICHQSIFFKTLLFDIYGNYDLSYKVVGDFEKIVRFYKKGKKFKHSSMIICNYLNDGFSANNYYKSNIERLSVLKKNEWSSIKIIIIHWKYIIYGWLYQQKIKLTKCMGEVI